MTQLLLNLFVKNHTSRDDPHVRAAIGTLSGWVGIGCNLLLFALKLLLGLLSGSISVTADAMNNLSDASGSIVTVLGFRMAGKPADDHHPYGHARAEYLSALAVAVMVLFIGLETGKSAVSKILSPQPTFFSPLSVFLLGVSILVKLWLYLFYRTLGKKIGSGALLASAADSRNDCIATAAVLAAGALSGYPSLRADGWLGLVISLFILCSGWKLAKETVSTLLGEAPDPGLRAQLEDYISRQSKVLGYHDLMIHDYGPAQRYATVHVEMDHREDPLECHALIDDMEWECLCRYGVHLLIHYDPLVIDDPEINRLQSRLHTLLQGQDHRLHLHDLRLIQGRRHMNLLFHLPLPADLQGQEDAIRTRIEDSLNAGSGKVYHVTITFDSTAFN